MLELEQGVVEVASEGVRHASHVVLDRLARGETVRIEDYYFRTAIRFRTGAASLAQLNHLLAIGVGERLPESVRLDVYAVP